MTRQLVALPEAVQTRLDELKTSLRKALGDDLTALLAYGSAVRGEWRDGRSDVDVIVVVKSDARERLLAMANPLQVARFSARIEAMILVADDIPRAADAFPLLYQDIKSCHVVLCGADPFADLTIPQHHLRVRIEQELREAQIRLRRAVTDGAGAKDALAGAVRRKIRQLRSPLRALLDMRQVQCPDTLPDVYAAAGRTYGLDTACLLHVGDDPDKAYEAFVRLLAAAIADVDQREEP